MRIVTFYHVRQLRRFGLRRWGVLMRTETYEDDSRTAVDEFVVSTHFTWGRAAVESGRRNKRRREIASIVNERLAE